MTNPLGKLNSTSRLVWLGLLFVYLGIQVGRQLGVVQGPTDWYLADLICLPLVLGAVLMVHRLAGCPEGWTLPSWHGVFGVVVFAIYFEMVLPFWKPGTVGDVYDALAYLLGWLFFELLINRPQRKSRDPKTAAFLLV